MLSNHHFVFVFIHSQVENFIHFQVENFINTPTPLILSQQSAAMGSYKQWSARKIKMIDNLKAGE